MYLLPKDLNTAINDMESSVLANLKNPIFNNLYSLILFDILSLNLLLVSNLIN